MWYKTAKRNVLNNHKPQVFKRDGARPKVKWSFSLVFPLFFYPEPRCRPACQPRDNPSERADTARDRPARPPHRPIKKRGAMTLTVRKQRRFCFRWHACACMPSQHQQIIMIIN